MCRVQCVFSSPRPRACRTQHNGACSLFLALNPNPNPTPTVPGNNGRSQRRRL